MRDLEALLTSFVNIDRISLIAILTSEAAAADRLANSVRKRAMVSRRRRDAAIERAARVNRILSFFRDGETSSDMSEADLAACKLLEQRLRGSEATD
jgi:hypothetical protein